MSRIASGKPLGRAADTLASVRREFQRYRGALGWLLGSVFRLYPRRLVMVVLGSAAGVAVAGVAVLLLVSYAQLLEAGEYIRVAERQWAARDETVLLVVALVVAAMVLIGAANIYWARREGIRLATDMQLYWMQQVASAYGGELANPAAYLNDRALQRGLVGVQTGSTRIAGMALRRLLKSSVAVFIALAGAGAMFWLQPWVTLAGSGLLSVAMIFYYLVNKGAVEATKRFEVAQPKARRAGARLIKQCQSSMNPTLAPPELASAPETPLMRAATEAFRDRVLAAAKAEFIGYMLFAVGGSALVFYLGRAAVQGELAWTSLLAYLVVFRITIGAVRQVFQTLATFSRFYRGIFRLFAYLSSAAPTKRRFPALGRLPVRIPAGALREEGVPERFTLRAGQAQGLVLPVTLSRHSVAFIARALAGPNPTRRERIKNSLAIAHLSDFSSSPLSPLQLMGLPPTWRGEELDKWLGQSDRDNLSQHTPTLTAPLDSNGLRIPLRLQALLSLAAAVRLERPLLLASIELASEIPDVLTRMLSDRCFNLWVCARYPVSRRFLDKAVSVSRLHVIAADGSTVAIGGSPWLREKGPEIELLLESRAAGIREGAQPDDAVDDADHSEEGI